MILLSGTDPSPLGSMLVLLACCGLPLLVVAAIVWVVASRPTARPPQILTSPPDPSWLRRPQPGEIWWAHVHYSDGYGAKHRPCLVIRTHSDLVEVLKITSQNKSHRWDHLEIPQTRLWDRRAKYDSYLDLSAPLWLRNGDFTRKAGVINQWAWNEVRKRHATGWVVRQPLP